MSKLKLHEDTVFEIELQDGKIINLNPVDLYLQIQQVLAAGKNEQNIFVKMIKERFQLDYQVELTNQQSLQVYLQILQWSEDMVPVKN